MAAYLYELGSFGQSGGGTAFDNGDFLEQQGYNMGCGANGVRLSNLHVENWSVALSHVQATYTSLQDPGTSISVPGTGNIRGSRPRDGEHASQCLHLASERCRCQACWYWF